MLNLMHCLCFVLFQQTGSQHLSPVLLCVCFQTYVAGGSDFRFTAFNDVLAATDVETGMQTSGLEGQPYT